MAQPSAMDKLIYFGLGSCFGFLLALAFLAFIKQAASIH